MANPDAPFGFKVVRSRSGNASNQVNEYAIASAYGTAIYTGDIVKQATDGTLVLGTAGAAITGVFQGCRYTNSQGERKFSAYWPASTVATDIVGLVADDPSLVLEVQSDGSMTNADIGQLVDLDTSQTGAASTGMSKMQTSATGGSENQFRIYGIYGVGSHSKPCRNAAGNPDMLAGGTNAVVLVTIANHVMSGASGAVEV
jgi:hypothetical protein